MSKSTWTGAVNSDWAETGNWSPSGVPGAGSDVTIATRAAVASASIGTVNSITDSSVISFESAGTNAVATILDNTGSLHVDDNAGAGGTILKIGGTLTNSHRLTIGNATLSAPDEVTAASLDNTGRIYLTGSSANQALLDVTAGSAGFGAAGTLSGYVRLVGDSAIEFTSGPITSLAKGAHLGLNGTDAFIEDSTKLGSNSALTGLASIGVRATFTLHDGAAVSTSGALVNDGNVYLDRVGGDGGSSLTLAGALTTSGSLTIGNTKLSAPDKVTVASLDNKAGDHRQPPGSIDLTGSGANQALLDVTGAAGFGAAGVLSGDVELTGDSAIEFASGQITSLAANAQLQLNGNNAFIEDSTKLGSNSALAGLASIGARAIFGLRNKAAVSTTGALVNAGFVGLDFVDRDGGSSLTLAGALTNSDLTIGNTKLSSSDKVTAASLDNTGSIDLIGSVANQALLDVTTGVAGFGTAGVLNGFVELAGDSAIEFASGQISTIAAHAELFLLGNDAFVEDSTALGSNSALTGLASIVFTATLGLENKAAVSTTGSLANNGTVYLDPFGGGSNLTVGGTLTNTGNLDIGNSNDGGLSSSDSVTANSFDNSGTVALIGNGAVLAALSVSGAITNTGVLDIAFDTEELAGAVGGTGSISLLNANLQFDSSVSAGQTIKEEGANANALILKEAQSFAATISGFGTRDTIDATNFHAPPATTFNFVENIAGTGGTLTLQDGSLTANIQMTGDYSKSSFTLAPDSGTGTLVKFV